MASERKRSNSNGRPASNETAPLRRHVPNVRRPSPRASVKQHYAVCVRNDDYPASLELRKLYPILEDAFASEHGLMRVIDESGEDYLYPDDFFVRIELPASVEKALANIA
jgi:hypothetical protein